MGVFGKMLCWPSSGATYSTNYYNWKNKLTSNMKNRHSHHWWKRQKPIEDPFQDTVPDEPLSDPFTEHVIDISNNQIDYAPSQVDVTIQATKSQRSLFRLFSTLKRNKKKREYDQQDNPDGSAKSPPPEYFQHFRTPSAIDILDDSAITDENRFEETDPFNVDGYSFSVGPPSLELDNYDPPDLSSQLLAENYPNMKRTKNKKKRKKLMKYLTVRKPNNQNPPPLDDTSKMKSSNFGHLFEPETEETTSVEEKKPDSARSYAPEPYFGSDGKEYEEERSRTIRYAKEFDALYVGPTDAEYAEDNIPWSDNVEAFNESNSMIFQSVDNTMNEDDSVNKTDGSLKKKKSIRRSLSRIFTRDKRSKLQKTKSTENTNYQFTSANISSNEPKDPLPNFNFNSLMLNETIRDPTIRPESPHLDKISVIPTYEKIFSHYGCLGLSSTQFEAFECNTKSCLQQLSFVWNMWKEEPVSKVNEQGEEATEFQFRVISKIWRSDQLKSVFESMDNLLIPCNDKHSKIQFFKYGVSPKSKNNPLLSEGGRITLRIPEDKLHTAWCSLISIILKEELMWSNIDNNIVGLSWCRYIDKYTVVTLHLTKGGFEESGTNILLNEVMLVADDELKPLFNHAKYYDNKEKKFHTLNHIL